MALWSHEIPSQLRIINVLSVSRVFGFQLELEDLGFQLELEDLGFQLELEDLGFQLELQFLGTSGTVTWTSWSFLSRVLCAHVYRCRFLDSLLTVGS